VKSFLRARILSKDLGYRDNITGTPQGGILSPPLLSNIALSVLDGHFDVKWKALGPDWTRAKRHRQVVWEWLWCSQFWVGLCGT
jgi:RNA-directed DNA polymerase